MLGERQSFRRKLLGFGSGKSPGAKAPFWWAETEKEAWAPELGTRDDSGAPQDSAGDSRSRKSPGTRVLVSILWSLPRCCGSMQGPLAYLAGSDEMLRLH